MKIVLFGDVMFGRDNNPFVSDPFYYVQNYLKEADMIVFNLETVIGNISILNRFKENKTFNYVSKGKQLLYLKNYANNKPIFVSIANNHSLDYGITGYKSTVRFLRNNNFNYSLKYKPSIYKNICFINATDHCGCTNKTKWKKKLLYIDYTDLTPVFDLINKYKDYYIIFSIHWGSNWIPSISSQNNMIEFGRQLVDQGVDLVFGHSAHHIPPKIYEKYKNKYIIYGLGDFVNDYSVDYNYNSDLALMCIIENNKIKFVPVQRQFTQQNSSIPIIVDYL